MDCAFFDRALRPVEYRCLGLRLRPLTLGHVFLLFRFQSPFVAGGDTPTRGDLVLAAFICALPWRESEKKLSSFWLAWFMRYWGFCARKLDFENECDGFNHYLGESLTGPKVKTNPLDSQPEARFATPWPFMVLARLAREFHMSRDAAMDIPLIEATALFTANAELNGATHFVTPRDQEFLDLCRELDKAKGHN